MTYLQNKEVYFSSVGLQPIVIINSIWIYSKKFGCPSNICLFPTEETEKYIDFIDNKTRLFCNSIRTEYFVVDEINISSLIDFFIKIIEKYKKLGYKTVIDVTAGRKTMSISLYSAAIKANSDKIIYIHLKDSSYMGVFYPSIPKSLVSLVVLYEKH